VIRLTLDGVSWSISEGEVRSDDGAGEEAAREWNEGWRFLVEIGAEVKHQNQDFALARHIRGLSPEVQIDLSDHEPDAEPTEDWPVRY
jgi:hypothetical protein